MTSFITSRMTAPSTTPHAWLLAAAVCLLPATAWSQAPCQAPGTANTACGQGALINNTTGFDNTAMGRNALLFNTTGFGNTASGSIALISNTTGNNNTASGRYGLANNTTGNNNTAMGRDVLISNTTGNNNTAMGSDALLNLAAGSNNVALGFGAGRLTTSGNSNIYVGNFGINGPESRVIRIGRNNVQQKTFTAGIAGVALPGASVVVRSSGQLGVIASSARYKMDIKPIGEASDDVAAKLAKLRPVSYRYKSEPDATHYGLIAEEVEKVMPEIVIRDEKSRPETVQYIELIPLLLQQWKAQRAKNERLRAQMERQGAELAELRRLVSRRHASLEGTTIEARAGSK